VKRVIGWESLAIEAAAAAVATEGPFGSVLTLGVFDGLHRGHMKLLAAAERLARAAGLQRVHIGFTPHPDQLIRGSTPLQLLDAGELELRMAEAGVDLWCDLPFTPEMRDTPWQDFIEKLVVTTAAKSIVLSPESAFGRGRQGTLPNIRAWGAANGLQVHPVAEAIACGTPIRSTRIREAIAGGDLTGAARLLGRPYALVGLLNGGQVRLAPNGAAVPPPGAYRARLGVAGRSEGRLPLVGRLTTVRIESDGLTITLLRPEAADGRFEGGPVRVAILGGSLQA
jgi:riboflavin kinase/FMN adenylyltransferase